MTGLILKDILVMRKTLKAYALFLAFYLLMAILGMFSISFIVTFLEVVVLMLPLSIFAYDEQAKWERYAMSLPLGRRTVVCARYLLVVLLVLGTAAFGLAACLLLGMKQPDELAENVASVLTCLGFGLLVVDLMLPLSYKLGPERARPYLYAIIFLPIIALFAAVRMGFRASLSFLDQMSDRAALGCFALIPLVALLGLAVSFPISCRIMEHKEF